MKYLTSPHRTIKRSLIVAFIALASVATALVIVPINGHIRLMWDYSVEAANTNLYFNFYWTTNIPTPLSNWVYLTNIVSTDALDTNDGSYHLDLTVTPGQYHFVATASNNIWGESITSNVATTPPVPQSINTLKIQKRP